MQQANRIFLGEISVYFWLAFPFIFDQREALVIKFLLRQIFVLRMFAQRVFPVSRKKKEIVFVFVL